MGREKDGYRDNLEIINMRFPDHDLLTIEEVMQITGMRSRNTVIRHLGDRFVNHRISKVYIARYMCG